MTHQSSLTGTVAGWGNRINNALPSWLSFSGVLSRRNYLLSLLCVAIPALVLLNLDMVRPLQVALSLPLVFVTLSLVVRRLRDAHKSLTNAWWALVPIAGWVVLAVHTASPTPGSETNRRRPSRVLPGMAIFFALLLVGSSAMALPNEAGTTTATSVAEDSVEDTDADEDLTEQEGTSAGDSGGTSESTGGLAGDSEEAAEEEAAEGPGEGTAEDATEPVVPEVTPPVGPSSGELADLLGALRVEEEFSGGYDRSLFRHWIDASGNGCDARREVLIAESTTPVSVGPGCSLSGGTWYSAFDGVTTTNPSDFDIDHFVPLKEAWDSGAHAWDSGTRQRFANDLDFPGSLIAVSASSNRSKGAGDPAEWLPPNSAYRCTYLITWVEVKIRWNLSADPREVQAIRQAGASC